MQAAATELPKNAKVRPVQTGRHFLNAHASSQRFALSMAVTCGAFSTVLMLIQWLCFGYVAEKLIVQKIPLADLNHLLTLFAVALIGRTLLTRAQTEFSQTASLRIRRHIRLDILAHWRTSSPIHLKETSVGASAAQWVEEVEAMDGYFSRYWPQQILALISPLLILCVVAYLNWLCALLLLISAPLIPLFMILVGMGAESLNQRYSSIRQRLAGHFLDRVANLSTIKLFGAQECVFAEVGEHSDHYRKVVIKTLKLAFLSSAVLEFFTSIAIASLAIYIGFSLYGAITWGPAAGLTLFTGLVILVLAPEFFQPLRNLSQYYHDRATALGAANNLVLLLNTSGDARHGSDRGIHIGFVKENTVISEFATDITAVEDATAMLADTSTTTSKSLDANADDSSTRTRLQIHNLMLGYEGKNFLTKPLNVELNTGQTLVISGSSGSGKSTLLNIIAGYMPAIQGEVRFLSAETKPNNEIHKRTTFKPNIDKPYLDEPSAHNPNIPIAYLPQHAWIKNDSIYNNLAALAPEATKEQMLDVLNTLGLANELTLKHSGLNTVIGEHGQGLSGGQMQRIALARVLLNPSPVLLLDEPSAKLDMLSKQYIITALKSLQSKIILVIATHDPELIAIADTHINLDDMQGVQHAVLV